MKAELDNWFIRYTDPAKDGVREAVTGFGQLDLAGPAGQGRVAYEGMPVPTNTLIQDNRK